MPRLDAKSSSLKASKQVRAGIELEPYQQGEYQQHEPLPTVSKTTLLYCLNTKRDANRKTEHEDDAEARRDAHHERPWQQVEKCGGHWNTRTGPPEAEHRP